MPVYKDDNTGKWYFSIRYKDVYGVNVNIKMYINDCIRMYKIVC